MLVVGYGERADHVVGSGTCIQNGPVCSWV